MKKILTLMLTLALVTITCVSGFASEKSSPKWLHFGSDNWQIMVDGDNIRCSWVLDDQCDVPEGLWYVLDEKGNMVASQLLVDAYGNYYSFNDTHDGHYGAMRTQDGYYHGIYLTFNHNNDGSYGRITNRDGIDRLYAAYGVKDATWLTEHNYVILSQVYTKPR